MASNVDERTLELRILREAQNPAQFVLRPEVALEIAMDCTLEHGHLAVMHCARELCWSFYSVFAGW